MFLKNIGVYFKGYKFSIILILLLIVISLKPISFTFSRPIVLGAVSVFFLYSILVFNRFHILIAVLFAILISLDAYFAYTFSEYINIGFFASMVETNITEAVSMLATAWLPSLIIFTILFPLFCLSAKELKNGKIAFKYLLSSFGLTIILIGIIYKMGFDREGLNRYSKECPMLVFHNLVHTYTPLLYGDIAAAMAYYDDMKRFENFKKSSLRSLPQGVKWEGNETAPEKIFLIIGESAFRNHLSLYGYGEPTTPFLDSLCAAKDVQLKYYEGIAGANITRNALRMMLSFATANQMDLFYKNKSLVDMARDAGYQTVWISNQGHSSLDDTFIGYLSSSADTTYFQNDTFFKSNDLDLLPPLKELIKPNEKQFIVLHIVGSHGDYKDRIDETDCQRIESANKQYRDYDRSIHHTDRFLREVYQIAECQEDYLIYYTSDHGEEPGVGHGFKGNRRQFDVPMVTINNSSAPIDATMMKYIDIETNLLSNINTIYILGEIMGYSIQDNRFEGIIDDAMYIFHSDHSVGHYQDIPRY